MNKLKQIHKYKFTYDFSAQILLQILLLLIMALDPRLGLPNLDDLDVTTGGFVNNVNINIRDNGDDRNGVTNRFLNQFRRDERLIASQESGVLFREPRNVLNVKFMFFDCTSVFVCVLLQRMSSGVCYIIITNKYIDRITQMEIILIEN